jgi:hypothetical protein
LNVRDALISGMASAVRLRRINASARSIAISRNDISVHVPTPFASLIGRQRK